MKNYMTSNLSGYKNAPIRDHILFGLSYSARFGFFFKININEQNIIMIRFENKLSIRSESFFLNVISSIT